MFLSMIFTLNPSFYWESYKLFKVELSSNDNDVVN